MKIVAIVGNFTDERTIKYLDKVVDNYIDWAKTIK